MRERGGVFEHCFFFKQKTAYEMRISDWSSDVCSSDLTPAGALTETRIRRMPAMARFCASQSKRSPPAQVVSRSAAYWGEIASRWKRGNRRTADSARCNSAQESSAGNRRGCEVLSTAAAGARNHDRQSGRASGRERGCKNG